MGRQRKPARGKPGLACGRLGPACMLVGVVLACRPEVVGEEGLPCRQGQQQQRLRQQQAGRKRGSQERWDGGVVSGQLFSYRCV